ncbi:outer membrane lipoprotein carrier protein LolA [Saprospiraceae bacterium]|jgi:outer membrane lipoprotein-sorting protein|nr:outer membrane lipoprotein carrier protein LolA [Bacteroidota bacterium]MDB4727517.1 outer membrane lipoprotein carrier protein LolA [Saprospiraceae bacterium]MDF1867938.1 outer membrane lipoprotein carrier protein LolA [Saprospiraceae bacterium]
MRKIFLILLLGSLFTTTFAQAKDFTKKSDTDPAATAVLEKMKTKYDAYKTLEANFEIIIEIPEQAKEVQKGKLLQMGEKYRLNLEGQIIVSDGTSLWYYSERREEVQINDVEESEGEVMSPKDLMRIYESEDYVYFLTNEMAENGKIIQQIEFKPLDSDSEYSKLRLTVDKKTQEILRIKAFSKDGSRYTFILKDVVPNKPYSDTLFKFQKSECPNCHWEDLRI